MKPFPILLCLMSFLGCKAADFRSVDAETFAQVIEDTSVVRLDVRTANEYAQGHIPNALLIDVTQADFMQKAEQQLPKIKPSPSTAVQAEEAKMPPCNSPNTATKS